MTPPPDTARTSSPLRDEALVRRCQVGDRAAREQLAHACLPRVRRTVYLTCGGAAEADDLVQTALGRVFASLGSFRGTARFTTWLDRITVNTVRQHFRRRPLVTLLAGLEASGLAVAARRERPDVLLEGRRLTRRLETLLAAIKPKKRIAVVLAAAYGYSVSEIGELMGCSTETAKKRLQHGRRELLARIRRDPQLGTALEEIGR